MPRTSHALLRATAITAAVVLALLVVGPACTKRTDTAHTTPKVVNFYNWFDYIAPNTLPEFTRDTGIEVNYDTYDSNEVLDAKLLAGHSGYDLVVPTSSTFARERSAGVFQPLDWSKLPNVGAIDPFWLSQLARVDPGNRFAVPYSWGTTGIGFNADLVRARLPDAPVDSWRLIFDPAVAERLGDCGIALLDSPGDVVSSALIALGRDPFSEREDDLRDAIAMIAKIRPFVRYFHGSQWVDDLANGEICVVLGWSGSVAFARHSNPTMQMRYVIPQEGALLWLDVIAIPVDAPHVANAHRLLDRLLRPNVAAEFTNQRFYPSPVATALPLVDAALREDPAIYPPESVRARLHMDRPGTPEYERRRLRLWSSMKAGTVPR